MIAALHDHVFHHWPRHALINAWLALLQDIANGVSIWSLGCDWTMVAADDMSSCTKIMLTLPQAEQQRLQEAEKALEQAQRRTDDTRKALSAAEEGSRQLEGELQSERQALAAAQADAQEAHADAAQKKQVQLL